MADLPTSHTQLTWLEREEPMSLRLPLASTNTLLLSERKHAKDVAARREDPGTHLIKEHSQGAWMLWDTYSRVRCGK